MRILTFIVMLVSPFLLSAQSFAEDIQRVAAAYSGSANFVMQWKNYLINSPHSSEIYTIKKCENQFLFMNSQDVTCINGSKQVYIDLIEKTLVYAEDLPQAPTPDPILFIKNVFSVGYSMKATMESTVLRKYTCTPLNPANPKLNVWINIKDWKVTKIIQFAHEELGGGFVFELLKFSPICDAGPEINIQSYVSLDSKGNVQPTTKYALYEIIEYTDQFTNE